MTKRTLMISTILTGAAALTFSGAFSNDAVAKDSLVVAFQGSLGSPVSKCHIQTVAKGISEITGLKPELHAGGSAFSTPKKLYPQLSRGITDHSLMPLAYTPGRFPLAESATLPYISEDNKALTVAINKLSDKYLAKEFKGTQPLALFALPPYQIHLKNPVKNIATDLKGKRIRVVGKGLSDSFRALGADVVAMPVTQVYENMQKGVMDGFVLPNAPLAIFKQHEVSDYHVQANISLAIIYMGLSKKFWNGLSADHQKQIRAKYIGPEAGVRYASCFDKINGIALKLAKKGGGQVRAVTAEEKAKVQSIVKPIVSAHLDALDKKGLPAHAFVKDLRAEVAAAKAKIAN